MLDSSLPQAQIQAHVLVSGRVQGVGYRMATYDMAQELGLNGWVRNLADGRVEAVFEGSKDVVDKMVQWCRHGSRVAIVKDVTIEYKVPEGISKFSIWR
ncbi:acylphosphatase [Gloeocapsopsis dulcis]|uniref:acylphosphatase n=1 Tax=Gloeocapsopsis dulcis AAB1 = 1H9 TaxID=1433147 RepID=A0A6N8FPJ3_9CHRO|nr:acylphosphatase [Gloeocapsopsis dulcis]MUL34814.1 acylphosphatase [Gloeocapsopsis dulcis AAB1 = 1H9]WNN90118.1 acylphosphatase [Gloeocapsopsis dulcis]